MAVAALLGLAGDQAAPSPPRPAMAFAQMRLTRRILVRVPVRPSPVPTRASPIAWRESKGPKCLPARAIAGAALLSENSVDLILRDRRRVRARLDTKCPELDYYYGFYISPAPDGQICADRDSIRSRVGGQCAIERFRLLSAHARD